ncbi:pantothenate synthetase [Tepiditoga spiralis]|uniref:Pantothenate synthetase n=1 Tax=Tepiditoga spiralis TaxID=2108365 RepID=A0A7G1G4T6_9BACT|nr:pantoate--beta-alanine ligase [Tepiditoga spiralis]BBE31401.1 pantothenate synthetase [Tepiditoga spiralis]
MKVIKNISEMKKISKKLVLDKKSIGFVPTMGYLHEGHLSLVEKARSENDIVIVSIFVNPTQFSPNEDLDKYPRDLERDENLLKPYNVDYIFNPEPNEMYPENYSTYVEETILSKGLCGASRPTHFRGVTTIVNRLFNIVKPTKAYFGQKDAQQFRVLRKMVRDLNMDVELVEMPIIREKDGLAKSSRNIYLNEEERKQALSLSNSLSLAEKSIKNGITNVKELISMMEKNFKNYPLAKIDYIEIREEDELKPLIDVKNKKIIIALAVYFGKTRLIDNKIINC